MDFLSFIPPLAQGGFTVFTVIVYFRLREFEKSLESDKARLREFQQIIRQNNRNLNKRLQNLELQCSKRWSTFKIPDE